MDEKNDPPKVGRLFRSNSIQFSSVQFVLQRCNTVIKLSGVKI